MSHIRIPASLAGVALASVVVLSGCASVVDNAVDSAVDKAAENVAENLAEDAIENALKSDTGEDASIDLGLDGSGASVPSDFPSDVPLPDGFDLSLAMKVSGGFSLSYTSSDRGKVDAYIAKFGGWEESFSSDMGELRSWGFSNGAWSVTIGDIQSSSDGEVMMTLTVTPLTQ